MFFLRKFHNQRFYEKWFVIIISSITKDGKNEYFKNEIYILTNRLEEIEKYLPENWLVQWKDSNEKNKKTLIEKIKKELTNPEKF